MGTGLPGFEETGEAIWLRTGDSMDGLPLDIVGVVVAVGVDTEVGMLDRVNVSWVTAVPRFEVVEGVSGIGVRAKEG
jgi:hypothetical protein